MRNLVSICTVTLFGALLGACGSSADEGGVGSSACQPGEPVSCVCTNGTFGQQTCNPDGASFGACTSCGNSEPIAPTSPSGDTLAPVEDTSTLPTPVGDDGAPLPGTDDTNAGIAPCGDDPATQPVPCVDDFGALRCKVNTGYAGDELALCNLDPDEGMMVHFGPSDYDNPDLVAPFLLGPGEEREFCMYINTPNQTERWIRNYHGRMRPNSHHLIVTMPQQHQETQIFPWSCSSQVLDRWLFGSQDPQIDVTRIGGESSTPAQPGDPDYGLAQKVPANQTLLFDFHNVNTTGDMELREAWASFNYIEPSEVVNQVDMIAFYNLNINVPPLGQAVTPQQVCEAPRNLAGQQQPVYVGLVTAHAHERMTRFSVFHNKLGGASELVYETYDWAEPGNASFTNGEQNPPLPVSAGGIWGAKSGYLRVEPGESLSFECEFQNNLNQWVGFGDTTSDEMCNVFGVYYPTVGGMWNCFGLGF